MRRSSGLRPATEKDLDQGRAIFYVGDKRSRIFDLGVKLPAKARLLNDLDADDPKHNIPGGSLITVVQAEIVDGKDVVIGFKRGREEGVCALEEIELIAPRRRRS